jgi:phosphate transport system ATP-binding protein
MTNADRFEETMTTDRTTQRLAGTNLLASIRARYPTGTTAISEVERVAPIRDAPNEEAWNPAAHQAVRDETAGYEAGGNDGIGQAGRPEPDDPSRLAVLAPVGVSTTALTEALTPIEAPVTNAPFTTAPAASVVAASAATQTSEAAGLSTIEAVDVSAWFGSHKVLEKVSLTMSAGQVTALIGPSGCGKSTFLRILNRLHELVAGAALAGSVLLDGSDIYSREHKIQDARKDIGMVFQRPNPFPAMSIYDNVLAGLKLTGRRPGRDSQDGIVETSLTRAGLWAEVKDRLRQPGGSLSGGQQQRLCIARSLAVKPKVLLMDEPCSALDPTSTRVIEETMAELRREVTIVIVTHNMQQAQRVSQQCAFFLATQGTPGVIVEYGDTEAVFGSPRDQRTADYVNGRFG